MELRSKISKKREEGVQIANEKYFEECYNFFCQKAKVRIKLRLNFQKDNLEEKDMQEIAEFVYNKNIQEKNADFTALLLQLFYLEEELENYEREILE